MKKDCNSECKTCYGPLNSQCISCTNSTKVIFQSECLDECPTHFYAKDNICFGIFCVHDLKRM